MSNPLLSIARATGIAGADRILGGPPDAPPPAGPPSRATLAGEARAAIEVPRLILGSPRLAAAPRGDGSPVVDIPGWKAPESSMAPLRTYLRLLGWDARTWGLGTNAGNPQGDAKRMRLSIESLAEETGRRVALVGWSLGGVIAREVAREIPEHVSRVVTYGTPVLGGPSHTVAAGAYSPGEGARVDALIAELNRANPIRVPVTVIFSRRDGVVAWPACLDHHTPGAEHVEVGSTHIGLGIDPDVWLTVARRLAEPAGEPATVPA